MGVASVPPLAPLADHADEAAAPAGGRTLVMWPGDPVATSGRARRTPSLPESVTSVEHYGAHALTGVYDTVVSVGQLGTASDLATLLSRIDAHIGPHSVLLFCEPTIASDRPTDRPPHDITGTLWRMGFTVFECHRFRHGRGRRAYEYCWGRARRRPPGVPSRTP